MGSIRSGLVNNDTAFGYYHCSTVLIHASRPLLTCSILFAFRIDLFHIVCAHAYIGHVARYFSIIGETLQRWGKRILGH